MHQMSCESFTTIVATLMSKLEEPCLGIPVTSCRVEKDGTYVMLLEPTWMGMKVAVKPVSFALTIKDSYLELLCSAAIVKEVQMRWLVWQGKLLIGYHSHQVGPKVSAWGVCDAESCMTWYLL